MTGRRYRDPRTVLRTLGESCPSCKRPAALVSFCSRILRQHACEFCEWTEDPA